MCYTEDFWLGLKKIQSLTRQGVYILRIDVEDWKAVKHWAEYSFSLEGPSKGYTIHISHFSGDLPDAMANSTGMRFSVKDRNDDNHRNSNCARSYTGKQFYKLIQQCFFSSLKTRIEQSNFVKTKFCFFYNLCMLS